MKKKIHYGWIVIFLGMVATVAAHGFWSDGVYDFTARHEGRTQF